MIGSPGDRRQNLGTPWAQLVGSDRLKPYIAGHSRTDEDRPRDLFMLVTGPIPRCGG